MKKNELKIKDLVEAINLKAGKKLVETNLGVYAYVYVQKEYYKSTAFRSFNYKEAVCFLEGFLEAL